MSVKPAGMRPYEPTEAMRWAAKQIDPALTHEQIRALWSTMWSAFQQPAASAEPKPFAYGWRHVANEWADELCNALQGVRNIEDGTQPPAEVADAIQRGISRCRGLSVGLPEESAQPGRVAELDAEAERLRGVIATVGQGLAWHAHGDCRSFGPAIPVLNVEDALALASKEAQS